MRTRDGVGRCTGGATVFNRTDQRLMKNLVYSVRDRWRNGIPIKMNLARLRPLCWNRTLKRRSQTRSGWQMSRSLAWTDRNSTCRQSLICAVGTSSAIPFQTGLYCPGQPKCSAKPLRTIPTAQIWISISIRAGTVSYTHLDVYKRQVQDRWETEKLARQC